MSEAQIAKARQFRDLHHSENLLVLPNIWDPLGAMLLENLGYSAIATASASVAYTRGYYDGEEIPFNEVLSLLRAITSRVTVPVTADIETGYAGNDVDLKKNITLLIEAGIVGVNIEDSEIGTRKLFPVDTQCSRIRTIRKTADELNFPLFINARTDVMLQPDAEMPGDPDLEELLKRGLAYKEAGADCFYPIALKNQDHIRQLATQLPFPINILTVPGIPNLSQLHAMGVSRVSLGPSFLKIAIRAMRDLAIRLKDNDGLSLITENEITTEYIKNLLVNKP
jgi:2-methylisocitrate lyase-like PEP mutase family enzyme